MLDRLSQALVTSSRALSLVLLLVPSAFSSAVYTVTALTDLPNGANVDGLNNNNQISGDYYNGTTEAAFEADALSFSPEGVSSGLVALSNVVINDNGLLGGYGFTASSVEQAFIGNSVVALTGNYSVGFALSDSGQLAGYVDTSSNGEEAAIMTSSATSLQASGEAFFGINGAGIATGDNRGGELIYGNAEGVTTVSPSAGFDVMIGYGINSLGDICGNGFLSGDQDFYFNGTTTIAIPLPNGENSATLAPGCINAVSQVVGVGYGGTSDVGFIWDPVNGTQILNSLVPANWTITQAYFINNNGAILASGTDGTYTGYVLLATSAPEPSTLWLTGLCLLLPIMVRKRRNRRSHVR